MRVLVPSTVKFGDTWGPFISFLRRFWRDCPWPVVLVAEQFGTDPRGLGYDGSIAVGEDRGWNQNIVMALKDDPDPHTLLIMDDHWIHLDVNTEFVLHALEKCQKDPSIGCFRLYPSPPADSFPTCGRYGEVSRGAPYRISACQGLWKKDYLSRLLSITQDCWEFETAGSRHSDAIPEKVISVREGFRPMTAFYSAVLRGKWDRNAVEWAKKLGIMVDTSRRPFTD